MNKQQMYKTAYSPMFDVFVKIEHAHRDDNGEWIYTCSSNYDPRVQLQNHLFREHELTNLVL